MRSRASGERGAALILLAFALLGTLTFSALVIDYGVLWVARNQAQNAADAAAHAAAVALAFVDFDTRDPSGPAWQSAVIEAQVHRIWGTSVSIADSDITFPTCPDGLQLHCVRVDVVRDAERGNPLPTIFGTLFGMLSQDVRATATAEVLNANASDCLKPWGVPDRWWDLQLPTNQFNPDPQGGPGGAPPDIYNPPTSSSAGTGFTVGASGFPAWLGGGWPGIGSTLTLAVVAAGTQPTTPGTWWYVPLDVPTSAGVGRGAEAYGATIAGCNNVSVQLDGLLDVETTDVGAVTETQVNDLISRDPTARWDDPTKTVQNSCASDNPPCAPSSPRIVLIPVFDPGGYARNPTGGTVQVKNLMGLFIESVDSTGTITGHVMPASGELVAGTIIGDASAFTKSIRLVQ